MRRSAFFILCVVFFLRCVLLATFFKINDFLVGAAKGEAMARGVGGKQAPGAMWRNILPFRQDFGKPAAV
ncbi:hypothetical protein [Novosphingobium malaysiense]|uniref:Uncharacterized protein n=1 Tax=Novosphingobium malaysiense TaxID=1348853 RepID=A0A0B1ZGH3_9SPHN|nr:hypothetical protein [Novosphingobium malaysiense]KHK90181.1 hypothetical protein LK12_16055 [Novosphingobium malaysiense]